MNAVANALKDIRFSIPRAILEAVFTVREQNWKIQPQPIETHILNEVIKQRVLVDCNLIGGTEITIPLESCPVTRVMGNQFQSIYNIPKRLTQNRSITSVLNITFANPASVMTSNPYVAATGSAMLGVGQQLIDSMGTIPVTSTARVRLIGENVVLVTDTIAMPSNIYLRCIVSNDDELNNLPIRSYRSFSQLCIYAVKSYIYNEYIIQMDVGELYGGQQLGRFKEIVDTYADSEELYQTFLTEKMAKIFMMSDSTTYQRYLSLIAGGRR